MVNYQINSEETVSNSEVYKLLEEKSRSGELTYREEKILEHMKNFSKIKFEDFKKAKEELISLEIPRLDDENINKILDIMPKNGTEIRAIVGNSGTVIVDENINKILEVLKKYFSHQDTMKKER